MSDYVVLRILDNSEENELGASGALSGWGASGGLSVWGTGTQPTSGGLSSTLPKPQTASGGLTATIPQGSRLVVLRATAKYNGYDINAQRLTSPVKNKFQQNGWDIISVDIKQDWSYNLVITISANVYNAYTAEDARQEATRVLQSITQSYLGLNVYNWQAFLNLDVKIVSDYQTTTSTGILSGWGDSNNSNGIGSSILSSFAGGAGVSTPFAVLAGLIILLVILRR